MNQDSNRLAMRGFAFNGEMTASATHEIKNSLAVIKENAGLLADLAAMMADGMELTPQKLTTISGRIIKHVERANTVTGNLNSLAHSTDRIETPVDVADTLAFLKTITARITGNRAVALEVAREGGAAVLLTSPFLVMQRVWQCIRFLMNQACEMNRIQIVVAGEDAGVVVSFKGVSVTDEAFDSFLSEEANADYFPLHSLVTRDDQTGELGLVLKRS